MFTSFVFNIIKIIGVNLLTISPDKPSFLKELVKPAIPPSLLLPIIDEIFPKELELPSIFGAAPIIRSIPGTAFAILEKSSTLRFFLPIEKSIRPHLQLGF